MAEFDFDHWCALAKADPQGFFEARRREIEHFIESAPVPLRPKLWDLQHCIDCERARAGTPARAMRRLAMMMQQRLQELDHRNRELRDLSARLHKLAGMHLHLPG